MADDDELGHLLRTAFDAQAGGAVPDDAAPPIARYHAAAPAGPRRRRWLRIGAPIGAAAAVVGVLLLVLSVGGSGGSSRREVAGGVATTEVPRSRAASTVSTARPATVPAAVRASAYPDASTVGVAMPIIVTFNKKITDAVPFVQSTTVSVNGRRADGAWYFEYSDPSSGHAMEAHYRLQDYWPANATIRVTFDLNGVSAGPGLAFGGALTTLAFHTGDAHLVTVSDKTHTMTVQDNGKMWGKFPVSLGAPATPTSTGIKVIMEKGADICMKGPGYDICDVKDTQRLTYGGEYLHAAPWNVRHIEDGVDSSNGCTNLLPKDAAKLYSFLRIGDPVDYPNADGPAMTMGAGYGDWNVPWGEWLTGGVLATR